MRVLSVVFALLLCATTTWAQQKTAVCTDSTLADLRAQFTAVDTTENAPDIASFTGCYLSPHSSTTLPGFGAYYLETPDENEQIALIFELKEELPILVAAMYFNTELYRDTSAVDHKLSLRTWINEVFEQTGYGLRGGNWIPVQPGSSDGAKDLGSRFSAARAKRISN